MGITIYVLDDEYFRFRRWLRARDPACTVSVEPADDGLWQVTAELTKHYLVAVISRRWRAL